ncbi:MAG TPA: peptide-methionine (R)-S-oxide reductase MsrB [Chlamydiales bacterium]|nr:peptide-methionine (R)-S-oxide reductase MsrB [Chlamydiales bacterium]
MLAIILLLTAWTGTKITHSDAEWRIKLGEKNYHVMREAGTENSFLGKYVFTDEKGMYRCAGCNLALFDSKDKIFLGCGWPTFSKPIFPKNVYYLEDWRIGFKRYQVLCRQCDSHLGHVFKEESLRYCVNSCCLTLDLDSVISFIE